MYLNRSQVCDLTRFICVFCCVPRGERVAVCQRGGMFGELGLLGLTETGRRMRTAVSITECELLRMSKESLKSLIVTHGELRVAYRRLAQNFISMILKEAADHNSPMHSLDKQVHIYGAWQKGKIPDSLRVQGKVQPPMIDDDNQEGAKMVTTMVALQLRGLDGFPILHVAKGAVSVRFIIEYETADGEKRTIKHDAMTIQGRPMELDFNTLIKYKHGLDPKDAIVNREDIHIKVLYMRWHDHAPGSDPAISAQLGYRQSSPSTVDPTSGGSVNAASPAHALTAPHVQTELGTFTLRLKDVVNATDNQPRTRAALVESKLKTRWHLSGHDGPMTLTLATKVSRELPTNSVIRSVFRSVWQKQRQSALVKKGTGAGLSEDTLKRTVKELKTGIGNVLSKGDSGKSAAQAASFEQQQEKATDDLIKRLRDIKDQINNVMIYNQNFELHMNDEMHKTLDTLDKRIEAAVDMHVSSLLCKRAPPARVELPELGADVSPCKSKDS